MRLTRRGRIVFGTVFGLWMTFGMVLGMSVTDSPDMDLRIVLVWAIFAPAMLKISKWL